MLIYQDPLKKLYSNLKNEQMLVSKLKVTNKKIPSTAVTKEQLLKKFSEKIFFSLILVFCKYENQCQKNAKKEIHESNAFI